MQRSLDHDLLTDIPEGVCDGPRRYVTPKNVTHVFPRRAVPSDVSKISEKKESCKKQDEYLIESQVFGFR